MRRESARNSTVRFLRRRNLRGVRCYTRERLKRISADQLFLLFFLPSFFLSFFSFFPSFLFIHRVYLTPRVYFVTPNSSEQLRTLRLLFIPASSAAFCTLASFFRHAARILTNFYFRSFPLIYSTATVIREVFSHIVYIIYLP